eukprot:1153929-Pelagomonas_calceolata.AAC.7
MEIFPPKQRGPFLRPSPTILSAHLLNLSPTSYFLKTGEETAAQSGHNMQMAAILRMGPLVSGEHTSGAFVRLLLCCTGFKLADGNVLVFCSTTTGADTGAIVGRTNFTEGLDSTTPTSGDCLTSSNCNATSFCDFSMDYGSIPACDTETGLDTTRAKGMCLDKCELPAIQAEKERVALLFSSEDVCDNNDNGNNCATGFQCGAALTACRTDLECKVNTTTNEPELTSNSCAGMCFRVSLELDSAKFSDDADAIMVELNELASTFNAPCQSIFNSTTSEMLGSGATCSVTEEVGQ